MTQILSLFEFTIRNSGGGFLAKHTPLHTTILHQDVPTTDKTNHGEMLDVARHKLAQAFAQRQADAGHPVAYIVLGPFTAPTVVHNGARTYALLQDVTYVLQRDVTRVPTIRYGGA